MTDALSINDIALDVARDLAAELRDGDGLFQIGRDGWHDRPCIVSVTTNGENVIESFIRRAIDRDRKQRGAA